MPASESTLRTRRRQRLEKLISEQFHGNRAALARAVHRAPAQLSQYACDYRGMGEQVARSIEEYLHLPAGWMDGGADDTGLSSAEERDPLQPRVEAHLRILEYALRSGEVTEEQLESAMHLLGLIAHPGG